MTTNISYRKDFGLWWPDYDANPEIGYKKLMASINDMDDAIALCNRQKTCIQAGGHVGMWPIKLGNLFEQVITFEPDKDLFACLEKNVDARKNTYGLIRRCNLALDENTTMFSYYQRHNDAGSGKMINGKDANHETKNYDYAIASLRLDSLAMDGVDLILLDIEGAELKALRGMLQTIERCKPVIMLEKWKLDSKTIDPAQENFMQDIGYKLHSKSGRDMIYVPE